MLRIALVLAPLAALVLFAVPTPGTSAPPVADDGEPASGAFVSWRLAMDGTVLLCLGPAPSAGEHGVEEPTWFSSPPNRSGLVSIQEMLLRVALWTPMDTVLDVTYEDSPGQDGASPEHAASLLTIGRS